MFKALIIFGSTTGNTEAVAESIAETLASKGLEVDLKNVSDADVDELRDNTDLVILGASTWGHDEIEFQEDFEPFYDQMNGVKMPGGRVALFGCGDSSYEYFCGAVDLLEERVEDMGAEQIVEALRIDGDPDMNEIENWTNSVYQQFSK